MYTKHIISCTQNTLSAVHKTHYQPYTKHITSCTQTHYQLYTKHIISCTQNTLSAVQKHIISCTQNTLSAVHKTHKFEGLYSTTAKTRMSGGHNGAVINVAARPPGW